ncbi:MAG: hypothetical protein LC795_02325 [Acidobacteria bacterium]|nr:hypothetical protein [Acidobacteriota bacterium]
MRPATQRPDRQRAEGGFTILETVIALFIAMVIGFGAISLFLFSANFNAGASDRARALALAQERMETHRATPFAGLAAGTTNEEVNVGSTEAGKSDRRTFRVTTRIQVDAGVPDSRQKVVEVTVTPKEVGTRWTGGGVTLVLLRASDEIGDN